MLSNMYSFIAYSSVWYIVAIVTREMQTSYLGVVASGIYICNDVNQIEQSDAMYITFWFIFITIVKGCHKLLYQVA